MLIAYDAAGNVIATLDYLVALDGDGHAVGFVDFEGHARSGGDLLDVWQVSDAAGSGYWPENLGSRAHEFTIERHQGRISALVHKVSGHRREREAVTDTGSQTRPLALDDEGRTATRTGTGTTLPVRR